MVSTGKAFRLQRCSTPDGKFVVFALDHRGNLRRAMNPESPEQVTYGQMADFKLHLTALMTPVATGILLDPEYGVASAVAKGAIDPSCGLLISVEQSGYTGDPAARQSQILPGWSVEQIARLGAAGVKLLVYYHPEAPNAAAQEALVAQVGESCRQYDIPFFLEPLSYSLDAAKKKLASPERRQVVVETARRLTPMGVDVLKAEFPVDIADEKDEKVWAEACNQLSDASVVPWVLLSAGVGFEEFERQTAVACHSGASGVLVGRAVWKEAVGLGESQRDRFLRTTAKERMSQLTAIVDEHGRPWTEFHPQLAVSGAEGWYQAY